MQKKRHDIVASDTFGHKSCLFRSPVTFSDVRLVCACRQNIIQVKQKRRKTKWIPNNTAEDGVTGSLVTCFFSFTFNNVTHENPGCQEFEDMLWAASEMSLHCCRQSSFYLTCTVSCRQFATELWFVSALLVGKVGRWQKLCSTCTKKKRNMPLCIFSCINCDCTSNLC